MTAIYKYPVGDSAVSMPAGARLLTAQMQHGSLFVWAIVDPSAPRVLRCIRVYGTGHELPANPGAYLGTVQMHDGALVLHVFDEGEATR